MLCYFSVQTIKLKLAMDKAILEVVQCTTAALITFAVSKLRKRSRRKSNHERGRNWSYVDIGSVVPQIFVHQRKYSIWDIYVQQQFRRASGDPKAIAEFDISVDPYVDFTYHC